MKSLRRLGLGLLLLAGALGPAAWAAEPAQLLNQAVAELKAGRQAEAHQLIDQADQAVWNAMGLKIQTAALVADPPTGFGLFNPRKDNLYKSGEPILVYLEPSGYQVKSPEKGLYVLALAMDVVLMDAKGVVLWGQEKFWAQRMVSRRFNREFFAKVNLKFTGAPAGDYQVKLTVRDTQSGQAAEVRIPITFKAE